MTQFFISLKVVCGKLFTQFVERRLTAELPQAAELMIIRRSDDPSDDPRFGGVCPWERLEPLDYPYNLTGVFS